MIGMVDWATSRARMIVAFVLLSLGAGILAYVGLPKEGEPDIDVPALFVRVAFSGISAEDSEKLLVKPLENELRDVDGLDTLTATAAEGFAVIVMEFEFGWDKAATIADVRARVDQAQSEFPDGADEPTIDEINFSEFPILVISLSGGIPERTLLHLAKDMQDAIQSLPQVLEAGLAGQRDEMLEVIIDPLRLEAYNVTADELLRIVINNNQLVAAGEIKTGTGAYSIKIPSSFDNPRDVYELPIKVNGDRVVRLGELADIRLTFEDPLGTARFNGEPTIALQIVKRKGENLIQTVASVKETA
ncbi:MAG: efflux RND transporter permease subunit, partial [Pseudomonadota bacterium]